MDSFKQSTVSSRLKERVIPSEDNSLYNKSSGKSLSKTENQSFQSNFNVSGIAKKSNLGLAKKKEIKTPVLKH